MYKMCIRDRLYCTAWVFGVISALIGILGIAVLAAYSPKNGIILLVIAFLVSPVGIPMAAAWMLGIIQQIRFAIQDRVCLLYTSRCV